MDEQQRRARTPEERAAFWARMRSENERKRELRSKLHRDLARESLGCLAWGSVCLALVALLLIVPPVGGLVLSFVGLYWVVRLAVRHGRETRGE